MIATKLPAAALGLALCAWLPLAAAADAVPGDPAETQAVEADTEYEKSNFPWQASGRALGLARPEGMTKLLLDPESRRVIGMGAVGVNAGDLVAEATLAIEMGADAEDLARTIHPHPTLSETIMFAAEKAEGTITDLYAPKRR